MPKPDDFTSTLGERIKWIIREKRLKQSEFAKSLGISANYVYLLTSGQEESHIRTSCSYDRKNIRLSC